MSRFRLRKAQLVLVLDQGRDLLIELNQGPRVALPLADSGEFRTKLGGQLLDRLEEERQ